MLNLILDEYFKNHKVLKINDTLINECKNFNYCYFYNPDKFKLIRIKTIISSLTSKINSKIHEFNDYTIEIINSNIKSNYFMNDIIYINFEKTIEFDINNINEYSEFSNLLPSIKLNHFSSDPSNEIILILITYSSHIKTISFDDFTNLTGIFKSSVICLNLIKLALNCVKYKLYDLADIFMKVMIIKYILSNLKRKLILFNGMSINDLYNLLTDVYQHFQIQHYKIQNRKIIIYDNSEKHILCLINYSSIIKPYINLNKLSYIHFILHNLNSCSDFSFEDTDFFIKKIMAFKSYEYYYNTLFKTFKYKLHKTEFNTFVNSIDVSELSPDMIDDYLNINCFKIKNCIMCIGCERCTNCIKCINCKRCKHSRKLASCINCEFCENCTDSTECYKCGMSNNLLNCCNCFNCSNLTDSCDTFDTHEK